jgi:putative thioredoxin
MIDITLQNFQAELIEASLQQPVLLDIWAPWCAPCKALGPVLERLEESYGGRFRLAKLNSDEVPQLASQLSQMFGVRSIPFCVLFAQGQPIDGFVGALPEAEIRSFLDRHVPSADELQAEEDLIEAQAMMASAAQPGSAADSQSALELALEKLQQAVDRQPDNLDSRAQWVQALIEARRHDQARQALQDSPAQFKPHNRLAALALWLQAREAAPGLRNEDELRAAIAANKRDFAARFDLAQRLFSQDVYTAAMDELLEILLREKGWNEELARKSYVAILEIMTPPPEPKAAGTSSSHAGGSAVPSGKLEIAGRLQTTPSDPVVDSYRRKLSMVLF